MALVQDKEAVAVPLFLTKQVNTCLIVYGS